MAQDKAGGGAGSRWWAAILRYIRIIKGIGIATLFVAGSTLLLLYPVLPSRHPYSLKVGDIAPEDIRAPRQITYVSKIETDAARQAASAAVADVYDAPDPRAGRQAVRRVHQIMDFVRDVRADPIASDALKQSYLAKIDGLSLNADTVRLLLSIDDDQFTQVDQQTVTLVENAMSGTVREGHVAEVTRTLALKVSSDLPETLIPATLNIATSLVAPNSFLNQAATEEARRKAVAAVEDVQHTFRPGEVIVRAGEPVDELNLETMVALGLTTGQVTWETIASAVIASLLVTVVATSYLVALQPAWARNLSHVRLVGGLFLVFLLAAQFLVPGQQPVAFLFPAAALAMALRSLIGLEFSALVAVAFAGMIGYLAQGSLEMAAFTAAFSLIAAATLPYRARLIAFFWAGLLGSLGGIAVLLIFRLPTQPNTFDLAELIGLTLVNGLLSTGLTVVILIAVGGLTHLVTSLQLIDLMRPDFPLQRRLQQEALGTYQHTLSVANLVESAAEAIDADSLLARVGTLYHDIGKMNNPGFYIENRIEGSENPHETLTPDASAGVIKAHVTDGLALARQYHLPQQIVAFIAEHHGTLPILYFLDKARQLAADTGEPANEHEFHYPGPIPSCRETAILMLADGCESAVRANRPASSEDMEKIVERIIQQRLDLHQLDASGLTLNDLQTIRASFVRTLRGMYHPRIRYPGDEPPSAKQLKSSSPG